MVRPRLNNKRLNSKTTNPGQKSHQGTAGKIPPDDKALKVLWPLLHHSADLIDKYEEVEFTVKAGISHQHFVILLKMETMASPIREIDLARQLERSSNTMSTTLDCMERNGLITKTRDTADRRTVQIVSTPKGRNKLKQASVIEWAMIQKMSASLSGEEINFLITTLGKLTENIYRELRRQQPRKVMSRSKNRKITNETAIH